MGKPQFSRLLAGLAGIMSLAACQTVPERISAPNNYQCQDGWRVTGYYTPIENDFEAPYQSLTLKTQENYHFKRNFVDAVRIEGWGKTRFGWYLGYFSGNWHKSPVPLNSTGKMLNLGEVAVDNTLIAKQSTVIIPHTAEHIQRSTFVATDVGSAIKQKHVDVYTGEGEQARLKTYAITGYHQVCFADRAPSA
ncbi:3D domain-containing protein [Thalassotalea sp. PS06]|uniref:3D domain-containing protein n=1 Tax=Thalassotalea sp. PS06 TaxID=2594005 RepID=UPI00163DC770|nr:3D domain-containing protein [Thalassotalea sp. PS06]